MSIQKHLYHFTNPDTYIPQYPITQQMLITKEQFKQFAPNVPDITISTIIDALNNNSIINTKLQLAHFLAQCRT